MGIIYAITCENCGWSIDNKAYLLDFAVLIKAHEHQRWCLENKEIIK